MDLDLLRTLCETDLPGPALQVSLSAAVEAVEQRVGPIGPITEVFRPRGRSLGLSYQALEILVVTTGLDPTEADEQTLDPADYTMRRSGRVVDLAPGLASAWGLVSTVAGPMILRVHRRVTVTYQRVSDKGERDRVIEMLVKLDLANKPGLDSVQFGSWRETYARTPAAYLEERNAILDSLVGTSEGFLY